MTDHQDTGTIKVQIVDPAQMLEERKLARERAMAVGLDVVGGWAVIDAIQFMQERNLDVIEAVTRAEGKRVTVKMQITMVEDLP